MMPYLRMLASHALAALAEPTCAACDEPVRVETVFCAPCARTLVPRWNEPRARGDHLELAAFEYGGAVKDAIVRLKYRRRDDLARPLAALAARTGPRARALLPDFVVPVPSHPSKLALRTFDPAALLSAGFCGLTGLLSAPAALEKVRVTPAQAGLDRAARLVNLRGAYACVASERKKLAGARVVLFDDVRTTGATLAACHEALVEAGARVVAHVVIAVVPD